MMQKITILALLMICLAGAPLSSAANEVNQLSADVTFLISGGSWEDPGVSDANIIVKSQSLGKQDKDIRRGYYRLIAMRQPNRTSKVFLQQIQVIDAEARPIDTVELQEITDLHASVTDIRTDDTSGINRSLGFLATVYLKNDPKSADPDSWNVMIDEFGEIQVARESH